MRIGEPKETEGVPNVHIGEFRKTRFDLVFSNLNIQPVVLISYHKPVAAIVPSDWLKNFPERYFSPREEKADWKFIKVAKLVISCVQTSRVRVSIWDDMHHPSKAKRIGWLISYDDFQKAKETRL